MRLTVPSLRRLVAFVVASVAALALLSCAKPTARISIEFGSAPDMFEGSSVLLNGKPVGKLEHHGHFTRTSFPVPLGHYDVCLDVPDWDCTPYAVDLVKQDSEVHLIVQPTEAFISGNGVKPRYEFRPL